MASKSNRFPVMIEKQNINICLGYFYIAKIWHIFATRQIVEETGYLELTVLASMSMPITAGCVAANGQA